MTLTEFSYFKIEYCFNLLYFIEFIIFEMRDLNLTYSCKLNTYITCNLTLLYTSVVYYTTRYYMHTIDTKP